MKKRIGSVLLALALCLSLLPATALAAGEGDTESGTTKPSASEQMPRYNGGSGTESDPWLISSEADLQLLANTINNGDAAKFDANCTDTGGGIPGNYHDYYFKQTTDLDLSDIVNWDPIGYSGSCYFAGHYDGDGHTISNVKSTGKNDADGFATAGIFGWVSGGSVKNLTVKNANFVATGQDNYSFVGGVAAVAFAASIENCTVKNSALESKRDNNNNCAGGVAGYSTGTTFKNCASISNNIQSMAYGGGFVGENDDDYGVGDSKYTDCYAVNCSVAAKTEETRGTSFAGGFIGMIVSDIALTNCYVYKQTLSTEGTSASNAATGVFAAYSFTNGSTYTASINTTNCYYGECAVTTNVGSATEKTSEEFTNGTVAKALGAAFAQGKLYPVFATDPADYTAVDAAIAEAKSLNKSDYTDFSAVDSAVNAVVRDKKIAEQAKVDAMAKAIEDAIAALVKKPSPSSSSSSSSSRPSYSITTPDKTENGSVNISSTSAKRGSVVTITVTPDAGYVLDELTVTDKDGKELSLTKKSDTEYTFVMPAGKVEITPSFVKQAEEPSRVFVDVKTGDYFYDAVLWAVEKGITNGTSAETFSPEDPCTRAQIVTFLWRAAGSPVVNYAMNMTDVAADAYYAEAVRWALSEGVTTGTSADQFSPDATCTREQAVTFLWRAAGSPAVSGESAFEDVGADAYYARAVAWAAQNGVTNGISQALFGTGSDCTRAQIVTFLYRAQQGK